MERLWDHPPPPRGTAQRGQRPRYVVNLSDRPHFGVGIQPPPAHPPPRNARTPHYLRGSRLPTPTETNHEQVNRHSVSRIQIGDGEDTGFVHKIPNVPELPVCVRTRATQLQTRRSSRLSQVQTRHTTREPPPDPQRTFATMYFGEDIDNVIGCWSLRQPFPRPRSATLAAMERVVDRHFGPQHLIKGRFP